MNLTTRKERSIARRHPLLDRMVADGALTQEQADAAEKEGLAAAPL